MAGLMDLFIKVGVQDEASGKIRELTGSVGKGIKTAAKIGIAAVGAAATGIAVLAKKSVDAYANYQQLIGGVETLFSSTDGSVSAATTVLENASNAFKTAGLSANQYMETVTSFSAALVSSLNNDYSKAAEVSDMAITDMADNANKMGTSMDSIQAAYQGFAKQNYTMLDNLKLGYGGTKSEMERLLADAEEFSGVKYDINNLADVYEAIHVIQTELGITGTTAKEAASTISGSFGMLQGAWANFIAGLGNKDADIGKLIQDVVDSWMTYIENLVPVIQQVLESIGGAVEQLGPIIAEVLPTLFEALLPSLLEAAVGMIVALANALPGLLQIIIDQLPTIIPALIMAVVNIVMALVAALPDILSALWEAIKATAEQLWPVLESAFSGLASWFGTKFSAAWEAIKGAFSGIGTFFSDMWNSIKDTFSDLGTKLSDAIGGAVTAGVNKVIEWTEETINGAIELINKAIEFINSIPGVSIGQIPTISFGRFAIGKDYVPYDNYPAYLHKGEAVLTAREADEWRRGEGNGKEVTNNFNFYGVSQSDLDYIVAYVNRELN